MSEHSMPQGIARKLVSLMHTAGTIEKRGRNTNQKYAFVQEADLVNSVRPAMVDLKLLLHQTTTFYDTRPMYETRSGGTMYLTTVGISYTWVDGETGESYQNPGVFYGTGADTGDKGVYKAATGSLKYFLLKTLLIGSGDDPEADERVDQHAALGSSGRATVSKGAHQPAQKGGRSAAATDAQRAELKRLARSMSISSVDDLMGLMKRICANENISISWNTREDFLDWLQTMPSDDMGRIIVAAESISGIGLTGDDLDLS